MGYNYGINPSDAYTGVELTFFPPDPWSGLYNLERTAEDLTHNTLEKNYVAKQVADAFVKKAKHYYDTDAGGDKKLKKRTWYMYESFFGKLRHNGDIVFGNSAMAPVTHQPYPTHLEYGFWNIKGGVRVAPHPIMRKAIKDAMEVYYRIASQELWNAYNQGALKGMLLKQLEKHAQREKSGYYGNYYYKHRNNENYDYKSRLNMRPNASHPSKLYSFRSVRG